MSSEGLAAGRIVKAVHGRQAAPVDPEFETGLRAYLRATYDYRGLLELYARYLNGDGPLDEMMRRSIFAAACGEAGHGLKVASGVLFKHLDTFKVGDGVFIGAGVNLQGRFDGCCV